MRELKNEQVSGVGVTPAWSVTRYCVDGGDFDVSVTCQ